MYWKDYYHRIFQKLSKSSWKKFSNFCLHNFLETNSRRYFMDFFFFQMDKEYLEEKERGSRCRQALVDKSAAKKRIPWRGPNIYLRKKAKGVAHLATSSGFHFHFAGLDHAVWNNARVGRSKKRNARPLFCKRGRRPPFQENERGESHDLLRLARNISMATFWSRYRRENIARTSEKYHFPCRWSQYLSTWKEIKKFFCDFSEIFDVIILVIQCYSR